MDNSKDTVYGFYNAMYKFTRNILCFWFDKWQRQVQLVRGQGTARRGGGRRELPLLSVVWSQMYTKSQASIINVSFRSTSSKTAGLANSSSNAVALSVESFSEPRQYGSDQFKLVYEVQVKFSFHIGCSIRMLRKQDRYWPRKFQIDPICHRFVSS